jgi:hypothetical protein
MKSKVFKLGFALNLQTSLLFLFPKLEHVYTQHISGVAKCNAVEQETAVLHSKVFGSNLSQIHDFF